MSPPELHLVIGPVNTFYDSLEQVWPRSEDWLKLCYIKKVEYHGGKFEGNNSRALFKKFDQLEGLCPLTSEKVFECLQGLEYIVAACYGYELAVDYVTKIKKFSREYLGL